MRGPLSIALHLHAIPAGGHAAPAPAPGLAAIQEEPAAAAGGAAVDANAIGGEQQLARVDHQLEQHAIHRVQVRPPSPRERAALDDEFAVPPGIVRPGGEGGPHLGADRGVIDEGGDRCGEHITQPPCARPLSIVPDAGRRLRGKAGLPRPRRQRRGGRQQIPLPRRIVPPVDGVDEVEHARRCRSTERRWHAGQYRSG